MDMYKDEVLQSNLPTQELGHVDLVSVECAEQNLQYNTGMR